MRVMHPTEHESRATMSDGMTAETLLQAQVLRHAARVRRMRFNLVGWAAGTVILTGLWVREQWSARGAFARVGNSGNQGDWNPTLWAVGVGLWTLVVGLMVLQVRFERPATQQELAREVEHRRAAARSVDDDDRKRIEALRWLVNAGRARFQVAGWVLGMVVLTPIWLLIEWQDNGPFKRWSGNSQPGSWDPWILPVGGIWALVVGVFVARVWREHRRSRSDARSSASAGGQSG